MKYKLLKDLPRLKSGSIGERSSVYPDLYYFGMGNFFEPIAVEGNPDWFEPVIERWEPEDGEKSLLIIVEHGFGTPSSYFHREPGDSIVHYFKNICKYTEARDAIKKVLDELHLKWGE